MSQAQNTQESPRGCKAQLAPSRTVVYAIMVAGLLVPEGFSGAQRRTQNRAGTPCCSAASTKARKQLHVYRVKQMSCLTAKLQVLPRGAPGQNHPPRLSPVCWVALQASGLDVDLPCCTGWAHSRCSDAWPWIWLSPKWTVTLPTLKAALAWHPQVT